MMCPTYYSCSFVQFVVNFKTQRNNDPLFFKMFKNRSISLHFCKKRHTFCKKSPKNCKNLSKNCPLWRPLTIAPTFLAQKRRSRISTTHKNVHKLLCRKAHLRVKERRCCGLKPAASFRGTGPNHFERWSCRRSFVWSYWTPFDLPALAIGFFVEGRTHHLSVFSLTGFRCWLGTAKFGRNGGYDITFITCVTMIRFTVIAGVGQDMFDRECLGGVIQRISKLIYVNAWPPCRDGTENHMIVTIAHNS